jgi:two-component system, chemotaxis family, response regulator Rcp1
MKRTPEVLLVDDNPADRDLTHEALGRSMHDFCVNSVEDGVEALAFLQHEGNYADKPRPDLIVLDLNLPRKHGREVLSEVKRNPDLARIPVVIFSTSQASSDINGSYDLGANCYLRKPGNLPEFRAVVQSMADFWLNSAVLPHKETR